MAQITTGVRKILSIPIVYSMLQNLMGAHSGRIRFVREFLRLEQSTKLLDLGCGPADILDYLPESVVYYGFDISDAYISRAQEKYGDRGVFRCQLLTHSDLSTLPRFDVVLAIGVLHHLDDDVARELVGLAHAALCPGGRLITVDPCWVAGQNPVARFLISKDRGQNVRDAEGYESLVEPIFSSRSITVRHRSWVPYTHCFMECTRD